MAYKQEVKDYAKDLFLKVDENGNHKYTFQEIRDEICQKFDTVKKLKRQTIQQWATTKDKITKKSWLDKWKDGQRSGYKEAEEALERKLDEEEKIEIKIDSVMRDRANRAINLCIRPDQKLESGDELSNQELKQIQLSELIFNNLNIEGLKEDENDGLKEFANVLTESREAAKEEGDNQ